MKIDKPGYIPEQDPKPVKPNGPTDKGGLFKSLLDSVLDTPGTGAAQTDSVLSEPSQLYNINYVDPSKSVFGADSGVNSIIKKALSALDKMESYSDLLGDPGSTLKNVEPALEAFLFEAQAAQNVYAESGVEDNDLSKLISEILLFAQVENVKFQRGDYIE